MGCHDFRRELYLPRLLLLLLLLFLHLLLFQDIYLSFYICTVDVEFTAEIIAVIAKSLRASGHVPET